MKRRQGSVGPPQDEGAESEEDMPTEEDVLLPSAGGKGADHTGKVVAPSALAAFTGLDVLAANFGWPLLMMLFASQHLMKGFVTAFTGACVSFLYAAYKVPGPQMQIYGGVTQLPWAMKPVIGLISDAIPIFGYHKAPYILVASLFGIVSCASIGLIPQEHLTITRLVGCIFMMQMQFSICDLLTEAKYAEKMRGKPEHGPALMTYVWFGLNCGGLLAVAAIGPLISSYGVKLPFVLAVPLLSFILVPLAQNCLEERPKNRQELEDSRKQLFEQREACFLCFLMFIGTVILTIIGVTYESARVNAYASLIVAFFMLVSFSVVLRPIIAKVNAFFLIQTSLGFSVGGGAFYFYTDTPEQYPEGPHFSKQFFTSVLGVVGSICALIGVYSYQRFASKWPYRRLLLVSNLALCIFSVSDVMMFLRWNIKLGIPDHLCVLGGSILQGVIGQWMWMPGVVILSQLCPEGMEATMYALLAGCHNLGNTIASNCGALALEWLKCQPSGAVGESAQFNNLWLGALLSTILPMFTLLMIPWLIPDASQTDKLLDDNDKCATSGSLLRRWRGQ